MRKSKNCKVCGRSFYPFNTIDKTCSFVCFTALKEQDEIEDRFQKIKKSIKFDSAPKTLQELINKIVRLIDKGHPCISSGKPYGNYTPHAGHFFSTGAYPSLRYNLLNIYAQSDYENTYKSGNGTIYGLRLKDVFGQDIRDEIEGLIKKYPVLKLSKIEAHEKCATARNIIKALESMECPISTEMRISLRKRFNESLGIYK